MMHVCVEHKLLAEIFPFLCLYSLGILYIKSIVGSLGHTMHLNPNKSSSQKSLPIPKKLHCCLPRDSRSTECWNLTLPGCQMRKQMETGTAWEAALRAAQLQASPLHWVQGTLQHVQGCMLDISWRSCLHNACTCGAQIIS